MAEHSACRAARSLARAATIACCARAKSSVASDSVSPRSAMLPAPSGRLISITSTPATPLGVSVSINRNTQRIGDPQVNIS
jgi:hypothetical protein